MALYKEIVTKAVIGKSKKTTKNNYKIDTPDLATTVLGCWVINHKFKGYKTADKIKVEGSFDVNIWYSYDNNSKTTVINKKIDYSDLFTVKLNEDLTFSEDTEIIVKALKQPTCTNVKIEDNTISFEIEKELGVEVVGETKVKILVEEELEPWDESSDDIDNINEEYLK